MPEPDLTAELDEAEAGVYGTPWSLGVACDAEKCDLRFEGNFLVREDSTRDERLHVVLAHAERNGWRVVWRQPAGESLTYCPQEEVPAECPESKMDDGSHATDYEDSGSCPWCGERNPDWREVPGEQ